LLAPRGRRQFAAQGEIDRRAFALGARISHLVIGRHMEIAYTLTRSKARTDGATGQRGGFGRLAPVLAELATNAVGAYGATTQAFVVASHAVRAAQSP
jgi:hypothetical protein